MSFFKKLFGKSEEQAPAPASDDQANLIRVFDKYGQEFAITRDEWRKKVLPATLKSHWDNADELCETIISALNDGFLAEVSEAAERLYQLEPDTSRSACVYAIVLMKSARLDEAEKVLRTFLEKHGDEGSVLTNLAKVYSARGDEAQQDTILWKALTVDPNLDNGLGWYMAIARERSGEEGALDALRRVAQLSNSWRPQLWLARGALTSGDLPQALNHYREALAHAGNDVAADFLMQMSGDLGNQGHIAELLALAEPHFVPEQHGLQVGNNLIKAHITLGHLDEARKILDQLYAAQRPDWKDTLGYWDTQIAQAHVADSQDLNAPLSITTLSIEGPVWLKPDSPAVSLFHENSKQCPRITFLGSSATTGNTTQAIEAQMPDAPGRMSRALPLFLAEQVSFASEANVQTLIPWVSAGGSGFVLSGVAWSDSDALEFVRRTETKTDYVVVTHLNTASDPWTVDLRLLNATNGEGVANLENSFVLSAAGEPVIELSRRLIDLIIDQLHIRRIKTSLYRLPDPGFIPTYLLRLEQLLAVRCAGMEGVSRNFLHGEREIVDGNLQLCLSFPSNIATRLLLVQTVLAMNRVKPEVVRECVAKLAMLQKDNSLTEPAQSVVQKMLSELLP